MSMTDTNPLSGPAFDAIWSGQIEPRLVLLEGERRAAVRRSLWRLSWFVALVGVEAVLTGWITDGVSYMPGSYVLFFTLLAAVLVSVVPLNAVARKTKARVVEALCAPMGITYAATAPEPAVCQRLTDLNLLPRGGSRQFEDLFQGRRGQADFMLCQARLQLGAGHNSDGGVFRGQIFRIGLPRKFAGTSVMLRQDGWRDRFECPKGLEQVGLEDAAFNAIWVVFSDDQVEARATLTPTFMEQLSALETAYAGANIRCAFVGGDLMIALEGEARFVSGSMLTRLDNRARAVSLAGDIGAVFQLIDSFAATAARSAPPPGQA